MKRICKTAMTHSPRDRILADCVPEPNSGCWLWTAATGKNGYGSLGYNNKSWRAHRFSYEAFIGRIPRGQHVLHKCDQRCCVNPDHFFLGKWVENARDKVKKQRQWRPIGEKHHLAILNEQKVREIRASNKSANELAALYGVNRSLIYRVRYRTTWKHL